MKKEGRPGRPDDVSDQFADGSIQLKTKIIPAREGEGAPMLLIEGDATSLEYLGRLLQAQAHFDLDCGYGIDPTGAGSAFFVKGAEIGIYIHRLPCMDPPHADNSSANDV